MSPRTVRRVVVTVFVLGIAGMIAASIADNNGAALTAGLITAGAAVCLMVVTAVSRGPSAPAGDVDVESEAARLEAEIAALVEAGVDEERLRSLVRTAVRVGRGQPR